MKHLVALSVFTLFLSIWGPRGPQAVQTPSATGTPAATSTRSPTPRPTTDYPRIAESLSPGTQQALAQLQACDPEARQLIWMYVANVSPTALASEKVLGVSDPFMRGTVGIYPKLAADAVDNPPNQYRLMLVLAHEARHQWQYANAPKMTFDEQERDADQWTLPIFDRCKFIDPQLVRVLRMQVTCRLGDCNMP